ncbi:MAG: NAD(P)-dependent oxidoreductase [Ginsengibacter sp.]
MILGIIKETKIPADNRVAFTPTQCKWIQEKYSIKFIVEPSETRCFSNKEYEAAGIILKENLSECDILFGIKEVKADHLISGKTYLFFSHTKKMQSYNRSLLQDIIRKKIRLIDYECLEHDNGMRLIGFGFFAGIVGAHNGMMAYGNRTNSFSLERVYEQRNFQQLIHTYFGLKIPPIKIAVTGSGRVSHGVIEIMNLLGIHEVEKDEYTDTIFPYPVYAHLKGSDLYRDVSNNYERNDFHSNPQNYKCIFNNYLPNTDILMNGVYWQKDIPPLFTWDDLKAPDFRMNTIADISDDAYGSVPCNLGDVTIENPIYGVDKMSGQKTDPYLMTSVDVMAVGNLPNELPRDASRYFGEQIIKHLLDDLLKESSLTIDNATITCDGKLTEPYAYMSDYVKE